MKDEERAKLWRTLRVAAAILLAPFVSSMAFHVNQVIWTAAGFTAVLLAHFSSPQQ